ncbi:MULTISPECIES: DNA-deoxyinosine glycosylase [unclassified Methylophilus]|uniref:DNA-deoxyinosine glycosylase n=1 Tax=unclassified Methylophilus TaxID=2630143 RepID=UPI000377A5C1|nr:MULTISPECIES: DNA-deoxyinosine glycosylase [unclassified Methylophilus]
MSELTPTPAHYATGFAPVASPDARILILGTLPGIASLKQQQYYAHPQNAFWRILERLFDIPADAPYHMRCQSAQDHGLAIWDVCHAAQRTGSLDSNIQGHSIIANDINGLLKTCPHIALIACNGQAAAQLFKKHIRLARAINTVLLPSTSPANARLRFEEKLAQWQVLKQHQEAQ